MPNIFERLGLAEAATVEDVLSAYYQHNNCILDATKAGERAELIPITEPIYALCVREREDVWGKMRKECPHKVHQNCYKHNAEMRGVEPLWPGTVCDFATCPLLRDEGGK